MDFMKENSVIMSDRGGLKNNVAPSSVSKRQHHALLDVRNTVHKKYLGEPATMSKQFLEVSNSKAELGTPRGKLTPSVERSKPEKDMHSEDLDDYKLMCCPCNLNCERFEDDDLPELCQFTDADIDNLTRIWFGQGGRDVEEKFVFSPVRTNRKDVDCDLLIMKPDVVGVPFNDSGIELDIDIELDC